MGNARQSRRKRQIEKVLGKQLPGTSRTSDGGSPTPSANLSPVFYESGLFWGLVGLVFADGLNGSEFNTAADTTCRMALYCCVGRITLADLHRVQENSRTPAPRHHERSRLGADCSRRACSVEQTGCPGSSSASSASDAMRDQLHAYRYISSFRGHTAVDQPAFGILRGEE